jgi:predicted Zn-dependent protease
VNGRTYAFGPSLDEGTVHVLCSSIATRLPTALVQPLDSEPDGPRSSRRRLGWAAHVTGWMILGAVSLPTRTLVTDFPTCTGGAFGAAYRPLDRSQLHGNGRVVLVPIGDFPSETARGIAEHFRQKYSLAIEMGPPVPLPHGSFDVDREQLDSDVLLSTLARAYPEEALRTIVIGLTTADMFIRDMSWAYAFSNRLPPRFAVVSSARMDRGCMGIRSADETTQVARLRKMIGKNIGVLFYRLPLSNHPRSMMYGSIGGPQELDAMLEEF